jgi:tetratricopeptide (TPR) repeat protein
VELAARLPLALAVVAARAAARPAVPLAEIAAELTTLEVFHAGDQASDLRALFSWSYRTLSDGAARLFRLLGLHAGPDVALPAMASLAGLPLARTQRLVAELTAAHLLAEHTPGRYAFHDLLRAYAAELAQTDDRPAAYRRVFDHYLHTAHDAAGQLDVYREQLALDPPAPGVQPERLPAHEAALAWLVAEHRVLVATVRQASATGFEPHAWQLAGTLGEYFERRGHWHDWAEVYQTARSAATRLGDKHALARVHHGLGRVYQWLGRYDDSEANYRHALELFGAVGDQLGAARTWHSLGRVAELQERPADALAHTLRGLEEFRAAGDRAGLAKALNGVGWYHSLLGEHRQALVYCREALAILQDLGARRVEGNTWDSLGHAHHQLGEIQEAIGCYEQAMSVAHEIGDWFHEAEAAEHLGDTYRDAGDAASAERSWHRALALFDQLGHADAARMRAKMTGL